MPPSAQHPATAFGQQRPPLDDRPRTPVSPIASQSSFSTPPSANGNRRSKHVSALSFNGELFTWAADMSRPASAASDRASVVSGLTQHFPSNPLNVNPAPAYVAPTGAAQVIGEHRGSIAGTRESGDKEDGPSGKEDVTFAEPALALVNQFLDQLLYSFLSSARSTSMPALRPAVTDVLKSRLAREAIANAEEELAELLGGGDDEIEADSRQTEHSRSWDTELVWKRTRLRVMVYIRLGEMEDEDEQRYVREEELFHGSERRFSSTSGLVSWAAAIFLTSVLEYVAEQTLQVAGAAAYARVRRQTRANSTPHPAVGNVVVEEHDVEKVALNSTLGRLWRTWRKALRNHAHGAAGGPSAQRGHRIVTSMDNTNDNGSRNLGPDGSAATDSAPSTSPGPVAMDDDPELSYPEHVLASNIPLPVGSAERDVHEIEVPGLAADPDTDEHLREILLSELSLAAHMPVPTSERDLHEIETPGLARDVNDEDQSQSRHADRIFASQLALPMTDERHDVEEIEVPGLATDPDANQEPSMVEPARRNSFTHLGPTRFVGGLPTPGVSQTGSPIREGRGMVRRRSSSVPTRARRPMHLDEATAPSVPAILNPAKSESQSPAAHEPDVQDPMSSRSSSRSEGNADKMSSGGLVAGAVAGAAAVSAAAAATVFGSGTTEADEDESAENMQSAPPNREPRSNKTAAEIEELDKRKSLIDIKALAGIPSSTPPAASGRVTPDASGAMRTTGNDASSSQAKAAAEQVLKDRASYESYSLGHLQTPRVGAPKEEISLEEGPQDAEAIGVAQTSDVPFASPSSPNGMERNARDSRGRIVLGDEHPDSPTIKQVRSSADATNARPRSFSRKSEVSSTDQNRYVAQQIAQQRGIPGSPSSSQRLRTDSDAQDGTYSPSHSKQGSQVYEHPVIQRMVSTKRHKSAMDEQGNSLTSASIRGPEDFDMFVQAGETVKYTLTPEAVRDESTTAGAGGESRAAPAASNAEALRQLEAGSRQDDREGRSRSAKQYSPTDEDEEERRKRQHRRSISRPPTTNTHTNGKTGMMAREPRVQTESTRDFADFIRSTGPNKQSAVHPLMHNVSSTSLNDLRSAHINGASASRSSSPSASRAQSIKNGAGGESTPPVPPLPPSTKGTMQPRTASGASPGNADLIDFIRSGPAERDQHRISRSVAPFRNTMDSEQFRDMDAGLSSDKPLDQSLKSQNSQTMRSASQRTSINSRSALLSGGGQNNGVAHPAYSGKPQTLASAPQTSQPTRAPPAKDSEPSRKRYRNKDPYAIDFSDEEDDDLVTALPKSGQRKEESWIDFLNSMEPPKDTKPEPLINPNSAQAKKLMQNAKANGMNSSTRTLHGDGRARTAQSNPGPRAGYASSVSSARSNGSRPQPPASQFKSNSITAGNAPRPKMVARTPDRDQHSSTNDLASFLRDSGPPEDPDSAPAPTVGRAKTSAKPEKKKKKNSFNFFGRSKKKAYLDMP